MKRRRFLESSLVASASLMFPAFLTGCISKNDIVNQKLNKSEKKLIIIQLSGGNDGLNTFIPFENDIYYRSRPKIHIPKNEIIKTTDTMGLHPSLGGLSDLMQKDLVSVINSVGYPNASRSHFRAMDVWQSGHTSGKDSSSGWIGRYLDNNCEGSLGAIEIDDTLSLAMKGEILNGFSLSNAEKLSSNLQKEPINKVLRNQGPRDEKVDFLYKMLSDTKQNAQYLHSKVKTYKSTVSYPDSPFGQDLKLVSQLITSDLETNIFYASLAGFDTHARQKNKHAKLLGDFSSSISALVQDLQNHKILDNTLIMVFSEFGRRIEENGSMGTDHGKGNSMMILGTELSKPGFFNSAPNLNDLVAGDLGFEYDFRQVYASVLNNWLEVDSKQILKTDYQPLNLFS